MSRIFEERKTIPEQMNQIIEEICDDYCKWPLIYRADEEEELAKKCRGCPLTRLK